MEHYPFDFRQTKDKLIARVLTRYPSLFNRWAKGADIVQFNHSPYVAPHGFNDFYDAPQLFCSNDTLGLGIGNIDNNYPLFGIPTLRFK